MSDLQNHVGRVTQSPVSELHKIQIRLAEHRILLNMMADDLEEIEAGLAKHEAALDSVSRSLEAVSFRVRVVSRMNNLMQEVWG